MLNENDRRSAATSAIAERNVMAAHRAGMLIVVDVQNDFCPGGALAVPDGDAVVPVINRLAGRFAHRIVTQDWHPADHTRSEEHTSELQSLMRISYAVFCLQKKKPKNNNAPNTNT